MRSWVQNNAVSSASQYGLGRSLGTDLGAALPRFSNCGFSNAVSVLAIPLLQGLLSGRPFALQPASLEARGGRWLCTQPLVRLNPKA